MLQQKRLVMLGAYVENTGKSKQKFTCVLPDGSHVTMPGADFTLKPVEQPVVIASAAANSESNVISINTYTQHDGTPVTKTMYCPQSYTEILKTSNALLWINAVNNCVAELRGMNVGTFKKVKDLPPEANVKT